MKNNRICAFDIARALSVIEIVGFWHVLDYVEIEENLIFVLGAILTKICLSVFTFMSGFFLSKYNFTKINDIYFFYKKRFVRFYPLFFLSCLSLYIGGEFLHHSWFINLEQFLQTIFGISSFFPPMAGTVWYLSMLMFFYMITPLLICNKHYALPIGLLCLVFLFFLNYVIAIDVRILYYFPFYLLGLYIPKEYFEKLDVLSKNNNWLLIICGFVLLLSLLTLYSISTINLILFYMILLFGTFSVILISYGLQKFRICRTLFARVAFASMAAYLFHRQIYECFRSFFFKDVNLNWGIMLVAILMVFILSFFIQRIYNFLSKEE